jgi:hypothetical protein
MPVAPPTLAEQRLVCIALVLGMPIYATVAGIVLLRNGDQPLLTDALTALDVGAWWAGLVIAIGAFLIRRLLAKRANRVDAQARPRAVWLSRVVPLTVLHSGSILLLSHWMITGMFAPGLLLACGLFLLAIGFIPRKQPTPT